MNKLTKLTALGFTALLSTNAFAVKYGTDVEETEYKDYFINMVNEDSNSSCGAQMIAPQWVLTAAHCTPYWEDSWQGSSYSENGSEMSISLYQGLEGVNNSSNLVYKGTGYVYSLSSDEIRTIADNAWQPVIDSLNAVFTNEQTSSALYPQADLALIKLDTAIEYKDTVTLKPYFDIESIEISNTMDINNLASLGYIEAGESLSFMGWGLNEESTRPNLMQKAVFSLQSQPIELSCILVMPTETYEALDCTEENFSKWNEAGGTDTWYSLKATDLITFEDNVYLNQTNSGDSGTGIVKLSELFGLVSSSSKYKPESKFQTLTYHMDWILDTVNQIATPSHAKVLVGSSDYTFTIQNLSQFSEVVNPYVNVDSLELNHDCPQTLEPLETCTIVVTGTGLDESGLEETITINQETSTTLSTVNPSDETETGETENNEGGSATSKGGSSGGSFGFLSIISLLLLSGTRREII